MNLNQITIPSLELIKTIWLGRLKFMMKSLSYYARFHYKNSNSTFLIHSVERLITFI